MERPVWSKVVPYFPFVLSSQGTYFNPSKTEVNVTLNELAEKQVGGTAVVEMLE